jgi:hypothetical protein
MRINDELGGYHGWYEPKAGMFTQVCEQVEYKAIRLTADVVETLRILGCKFIETSVEYDGGHVEPFYITYDRFLEVAESEWNHDRQSFELVYKLRDKLPENERMEVRSYLY